MALDNRHLVAALKQRGVQDVIGCQVFLPVSEILRDQGRRGERNDGLRLVRNPSVLPHDISLQY